MFEKKERFKMAIRNKYVPFIDIWKAFYFHLLAGRPNQNIQKVSNAEATYRTPQTKMNWG